MSDEEIRRRAIDTIEALYPPDSPYDPTLGQELLEQARRDCSDWRDEPTPILIRLAQLNRNQEESSMRASERKTNQW
jgi:hypothetical protein